MPFKREMPLARGVTQSRWDYVNVRGFGAGTVALALRLPGVYGPWGRWGTDQHGELAVVEQAQRAEQPTAGRDRFPFKCGGGESASAVSLRVGPWSVGAVVSLWTTRSATISQRRVAMKVAFPGGSSVPEGQVPFSHFIVLFS